jgi:hypothetical protein
MKFYALAYTTATVCLFAVAAPLRAQTSVDLTTLRFMGVAGASAQLNSYLGNEIGGQAIAVAVAKIRNSAPDLDAQQMQLAESADRLQVDVDRYLGGLISISDASVLRAGQLMKQTSSLAVEAKTSAARLRIEREMTTVFGKAKQANENTLQAALKVELAKLPTSTLTGLTERVAKKDATVIDAVLAASPDYLQNKVVQAAGDYAASIIRNQLQQQLGPALTAAINMSPRDAADLKKVADDGLIVLQQTAVFVNAIANSGNMLDQSKAYVTELRTASIGLTAIGHYVENRLMQGEKFNPVQQAALRSAIQLGQQFLQGQPVSSSDLASSMERAGIVIPDKASLLQTFDNLSDLRKPEAVVTGLHQVQGYLALASSLGIKVDPNITRTVGTLQTAANVAMSFASGNYVGAVTGALGIGGDGMFGAGGGDPMASQRHAEIMNALNEIKQLQLQTLKAIDELSAQLARSTEKIMTHLDELQDSVDYLIAIKQFDDISGPLSNCRAFVRSAKIEANMNQGYFPSYAQRKRHFDDRAMSVNPVFTTCESLLIKHLALVNQNSEPSLPPSLWNVTNIREGRRDPAKRAPLWQYDRDTFFPMVSYTVLSLELGTLGQGDQSTFDYQPCTRRLIGALALAPVSMHHVNYARMKCAGGAPVGVDEGLKLTSDGVAGQFVKGGSLFEVPLHASLASELAYYLIYFHSYNPLITETPGGDKSLLSEADLAAGKLNLRREQGGAPRLRSALDIVNVALVQQTMLSGVYVATYAGEALKQGQFGKSAGAVPDAVIKSASDEGCSPAKHLKTAPYHTTVCMLLRHPEFARNVAMQLVLSDASASGMTFEEFADMLDAHAASYADILASFPTIYPYMVQNGTKWFIKLESGLLAEPLLLPLPSAAALRAGTIAYPEITRALLISRGGLLQELAGAKATTDTSPLWSGVSRPDASYLPSIPGL